MVAKAKSSGFPLGVTGSGVMQQQEETFHRALGGPAESSGQQGPGPIPARVVLWSWISHLTPQGLTGSL